MLKLVDTRFIFVHYPVGSHGWFLASLLWQAFDPREIFKFDVRGIGYDNTAITKINNFYTDIIDSEKGQLIIHDTDYDKFSYQERIGYLRDTLVATPYAPKPEIPQIIALSCCNINLFLDAFPKSKCIQINLEEDDWLVCAANYLRRIILTEEEFTEYCAKYNITSTTWEQFVDIGNCIKEFTWAISHVHATAKHVENKPEYDDRFFEIFFKEFMTDDIDYLLASLFKFAEFTSFMEFLFNEIYNYVQTFRGQQLGYKI